MSNVTDLLKMFRNFRKYRFNEKITGMGGYSSQKGSCWPKAGDCTVVLLNNTIIYIKILNKMKTEKRSSSISFKGRAIVNWQRGVFVHECMKFTAVF